MYLSECGKYIAIQSPTESIGYDIIAVDGSCIWLDSRYRVKGWDDTDPRHIYPEYKHMVCGFRNHGYENRAGRLITDFTLWFCDHDIFKKNVPYTGNTVKKEYSARFNRPVKHLAIRHTRKGDCHADNKKG